MIIKVLTLIVIQPQRDVIGFRQVLLTRLHDDHAGPDEVDSPLAHPVEGVPSVGPPAVPGFGRHAHGHPIVVVRVLEHMIFDQVLHFAIVLVKAEG